MASSSSNYPCAACKYLRRKCLPSCIFAPYFPPEEPHKFANVHKIFGASNASKVLNNLQPHQREDAVNSLAFEAEARVRDPVNGCVGAISILQSQIIKLQQELDDTNATFMNFTSNNGSIMPHELQGMNQFVPQDPKFNILPNSEYPWSYNPFGSCAP